MSSRQQKQELKQSTTMKRQREDDRKGPDEQHSKRSRAAYNHSRGSDGQRWDDARRNDSAPDRGNGGDKQVRVRTLKDERENDEHRLAQRQKQIDYGKNTIGYDRYCAEIPRHQRRRGEHPMTPDKTLKVSKKQFDGMVKRWRQALHDYDPPELKQQLEAAEQQVTAQQQTTQSGDAAAAVDDADLDPELADLDPRNHTRSEGPSIFDEFHEDDDTATHGFDDDDDDDLL